MNIKIRPFEINDAYLLYDWYYSGDYPEFFRDVVYHPSLQTFQGYAALQNGCSYVIEDLRDIPVGFILFYDINHANQSLHASILIDRFHQKSKLYLEALVIGAEYAFNRLGIHTVVFEILKSNQFLNTSLKMGGCRREGIFKYGARVNGKLVPVCRYAIEKNKAMKAIKKIKEILCLSKPQHQPQPQRERVQQEVQPPLQQP